MGSRRAEPRWDEGRQRWRGQVRWVDQAGRQRSEERFGETRAEVARWLTERWKEIESDRELARSARRLADAGFVLPAATGTGSGAGPLPTWRSFVEAFLVWLPISKAAPETCRTYGIELRHTLLPLIGDLRLDQLTPAVVDHLRAFLERKGRVVAPVLTALSSACNHAVREGLLATNPCHRPRRLYRADAEAPPAREIRTATRAQRQATLDAMPPPTTRARRRNRWALRLAAWAGLRLGEIRGLRVADLDLGAGVVHVEQQAQAVRGGDRIRAPKYHSRRLVPLGRRVWDELGEAALEAQALGVGLLLADPPGARGGGGGPRTERVPRWGSGAQSATLHRLCADAQAVAGIAPALPWRAWRRTFLTLALEYGYPAALVEQWVGHRALDPGLSRVSRDHYRGAWDPATLDRSGLD